MTDKTTGRHAQTGTEQSATSQDYTENIDSTHNFASAFGVSNGDSPLTNKQPMSHQQVLYLQRTIGNTATQKLIQGQSSKHTGNYRPPRFANLPTQILQRETGDIVEDEAIKGSDKNETDINDDKSDNTLTDETKDVEDTENITKAENETKEIKEKDKRSTKKKDEKDGEDEEVDNTPEGIRFDDKGEADYWENIGQEFGIGTLETVGGPASYAVTMDEKKEKWEKIGDKDTYGGGDSGKAAQAFAYIAFVAEEVAKFLGFASIVMGIVTVITSGATSPVLTALSWATGIVAASAALLRTYLTIHNKVRYWRANSNEAKLKIYFQMLADFGLAIENSITAAFAYRGRNDGKNMGRTQKDGSGKGKFLRQQGTKDLGKMGAKQVGAKGGGRALKGSGLIEESGGSFLHALNADFGTTALTGAIQRNISDGSRSSSGVPRTPEQIDQEILTIEQIIEAVKAQDESALAQTQTGDEMAVGYMESAIGGEEEIAQSPLFMMSAAFDKIDSTLAKAEGSGAKKAGKKTKSKKTVNRRKSKIRDAKDSAKNVPEIQAKRLSTPTITPISSGLSIQRGFIKKWLKKLLRWIKKMLLSFIFQVRKLIRKVRKAFKKILAKVFELIDFVMALRKLMKKEIDKAKKAKAMAAQNAMTASKLNAETQDVIAFLKDRIDQLREEKDQLVRTKIQPINDLPEEQPIADEPPA